MTFTPLFAHGALGNWDEMIFLGVAITFVILMAASWLRARARQSPELTQSVQESAAPLDGAPRGNIELE